MMLPMKTDSLALKAINQSRGSNIFSYLGLRYYLDNFCSRKNIWAKEVATHLVRTRDNASYLETHNFKNFSKDNHYQYRTLFHPGPNESLAETALIVECSNYKEFLPESYVYSYRMSPAEDTAGIFEYYYNGYQCRQNDILNCCLSINPEALLITDIVDFYPSLDVTYVKEIWKTTCQHTSISQQFIELGLKIINDYSSRSFIHSKRNSILVGPLFSHLLANLSITHIDKQMNKITNGKYWRYVDDIVIAGSRKEINEWRYILSESLSKLNLRLHDLGSKKDFQVKSCDWISCHANLEENTHKPWMFLIDKIKSYIFYNNYDNTDLTESFAKLNMRFPLPKYSAAVAEKNYIDRVALNLSKYKKWFCKKFLNTTINDIELAAIYARDYYSAKIEDLLALDIKNLPPLLQKKSISQLKFYCAKILVIGNESSLQTLSDRLPDFNDLLILKEIIKALLSKDISIITSLGALATQATAQLFSTNYPEATCNTKPSPIINLSIAIVQAYGVKVNSPFFYNDTICKFSKGEDMLSLMNCDNHFIKEISSLHGLESIRHPETIKSAFSTDEDIKIDIVDKIGRYKYL